MHQIRETAESEREANDSRLITNYWYSDCRITHHSGAKSVHLNRVRLFRWRNQSVHISNSRRRGPVQPTPCLVCVESESSGMRIQGMYHVNTSNVGIFSPLAWIVGTKPARLIRQYCLTECLLISLENSTSTQNRRLDIWICNSKQ